MAQRQRRPQKTAPSSNLKPFYIALAVIALAGVGWIVYSLSTATDAATTAVELTGLDDAQALFDAAKATTLGEPDAPLQIRIFSDFTCPACRYWVQTVEPRVKQEFIATGKARLLHYDFPLDPQGVSQQHRHGFIAARAARCAGEQDRFWEYHDVLFGRQAEWSAESKPPVDTFIQYASQLGLDNGAFSSCLNSDRFANVVTANKMLGEQLKVNGTPTVYIGERALNNNEWSQYDAVKAAIEAQLGASS